MNIGTAAAATATAAAVGVVVCYSAGRASAEPATCASVAPPADTTPGSAAAGSPEAAPAEANGTVGSPGANVRSSSGPCEGQAAVSAAEPWDPPRGLSNARQDSLAFDTRGKAARYHRVTLDDRSDYFAISCYPICKLVEDDLEEVSGVVSEEQYLYEWSDGTYHCARCTWPLYHSADKWKGPCPWPSWRKPMCTDSLKLHGVHHDEWAGPNGYNGYTCEVQEVYCGRCELFLGHQFADAVEKGDVAPGAKWRH